jgi:hypothetical protein
LLHRSGKVGHVAGFEAAAQRYVIRLEEATVAKTSTTPAATEGAGTTDAQAIQLQVRKLDKLETTLIRVVGGGGG